VLARLRAVSQLGGAPAAAEAATSSREIDAAQRVENRLLASRRAAQCSADEAAREPVLAVPSEPWRDAVEATGSAPRRRPAAALPRRQQALGHTAACTALKAVQR